MSGPHETDDFDRRLVFLAEGVRQHLKDSPSRDGRAGYADFAAVQEIVDDAEIVFGIWFDFSKPSGIDKMICKGMPILRKIIQHGRSHDARIVAIPCTCVEQAEALRLHIAEPDWLN